MKLHPEEKQNLGPGTDERKSKQFWCINGTALVNATGWDCSPGTPGYWWFPSLGFSGSDGVHCFENIRDAKAKLRKELEADLKRITEALEALRPPF